SRYVLSPRDPEDPFLFRTNRESAQARIHRDSTVRRGGAGVEGRVRDRSARSGRGGGAGRAGGRSRGRRDRSSGGRGIPEILPDAFGEEEAGARRGAEGAARLRGGRAGRRRADEPV